MHRSRYATDKYLSRRPLQTDSKILLKSFSWAKGIERRAALSVTSASPTEMTLQTAAERREQENNCISSSGVNCVRRRRIRLLRSYFCDMTTCRKCASNVVNGWIALECEITRKTRAKSPIPSLI